MALLACGREFYITLTERGGLVVRRANEHGQLGVGTQVPAMRPTVMGGVGPVVSDEVGELVGGMHALTLLAAPQAQAVGALAHPFEDRVAMVFDEKKHCVTDGGVVWAWGRNRHGQLGVDTQTPHTPLRWAVHFCNGALVRMVACGDFHTLVLTRAGEVWACGSARFGETGDPHVNHATRISVRVPGLPTVALVAAGDTHSGAVGVDGQVWMWGYTLLGRLGYAAPQNARTNPTPRSLGLAERVVLLDMHASNSAAVTDSGTLWVWG